MGAAEGDGRIVRALRQAGCKAIGSDVATGTEFLATSKEVDNVVTNPPWGLKTEFIRHAKDCTAARWRCSCHFRRYRAWRGGRCSRMSPSLCVASMFSTGGLNFDPDAQGSTTLTTGWFVWERGCRVEPVLRWLP